MSEKDLKLHEKLKKLDRYPFHMPGHKRNPVFSITGSEIDITEIDGFDDLHNAKGVILEIENRLSGIYKSKRSFLSVNGSTLGMLAAVMAVCNAGDKIIVARNCHKSVFNACLLKNLKVVFAEPDFDEEDGYYTCLSQSELDRVLKENPDAAAAVVTSPTYEGNVSCLKCDIPLIVDAAHAAHFCKDGFPEYPKGDIVVSSLHKTLPALTQTAVINIYNEKLIEPVKRYVSMLETSSPSYVLMNSASICCDILESGEGYFKGFGDSLKSFYGIRLERLKIKKSDDPSRIVVSAVGTDIDAAGLAKLLREEFLIEPEMVSVGYLVLISSVGDEPEAFERLKNALESIDGRLSEKPSQAFRQPDRLEGTYILGYPEQSEAVSLENAEGRQAAEFVYAYPPDVPIVFPGMTVTAHTVEQLKRLYSGGVNTVSESGLLPHSLLTKKA